MKLSAIVMGVAGVCTMLLGGYCIVAESAPVLRGGTNAFSRLQAMSSGDEQIGLSILSQSLALRDCQTALEGFQSARMRVQPEEFQQRLPELCTDIAQQVLSKTPANGQAELILAMIAAHKGDLAAMDAHLRWSQALSPRESFIAAPRIALAEANIDSLSHDGLDRHRSDLAVLIRGGVSTWTVAQLYVSNEAARPRIAEALDLTSPAEQSRFLGLVRRILDQRSKGQ